MNTFRCESWIPAIVFIAALSVALGTASAQTARSTSVTQPATEQSALLSGWISHTRIQLKYLVRTHPIMTRWVHQLVHVLEVQALKNRVTSLEDDVIALEDDKETIEKELKNLNAALFAQRYGPQSFQVPSMRPAQREYSLALARAGMDFENNVRDIIKQRLKHKDTATANEIRNVLIALLKEKSRRGYSDRVQVYITDPSAQQLSTEMIWNGHRYRLILGHVSWHTAKGICERLGGHLVTITSPVEQQAVSRMTMTMRVWIGATNGGREGRWSWVTGEPWGYTNWGASQPDNADGKEHYAEMNYRGHGGGEWNDNYFRADNSARAFICEWDSIPGSDSNSHAVVTSRDPLSGRPAASVPLDTIQRKVPGRMSLSEIRAVDELKRILQNSPHSYNYIRIYTDLKFSDAEFDELVQRHPDVFRKTRIIRRNSDGRRIIPGWPGAELVRPRH